MLHTGFSTAVENKKNDVKTVLYSLDARLATGYHEIVFPREMPR
jgi:hypothetical protein